MCRDGAVVVAPYYADGAVTIYHGDCLEIMPALGPVDHVITDPPYESEAHTLGRREMRAVLGRREMRAAPLPFAAIDERTRSEAAVWFGGARRWVLVFCQVEAAMTWRGVLEEHGLLYRRTMVWVKPDGQPQFSGDRPACGYESIVAMHSGARASRWNGGGKLGVFSHCREFRGGVSAPPPTTKPLRLMTELVSLFTDTGELVLDAFAGSGTTLRACKDLGRRAIGIEREERYAEIAAKRMQQEVMPW